MIDRRCPAGMVYLPGGTFTMGAPQGEARSSDTERPQHEVTLSPFCLARTEVTLAQYAACVQAGRCAAPNPGLGCNWGGSGRDEHPVNCVDWERARVYCESSGQRLPTEAEWEFAASNGGSRSHPWGDEAPSEQLCWSGLSRRRGTCPVGAFSAGNTPNGIEDLAGNVMEWVADRYGPYDAAAQSDRLRTHYSAWRVRRGGGWSDSNPSWVRARARSGRSMREWSADLGVRCAAGPAE